MFEDCESGGLKKKERKKTTHTQAVKTKLEEDEFEKFKATGLFRVPTVNMIKLRFFLQLL